MKEWHQSERQTPNHAEGFVYGFCEPIIAFHPNGIAIIRPAGSLDFETGETIRRELEDRLQQRSVQNSALQKRRS